MRIAIVLLSAVPALCALAGHEDLGPNANREDQFRVMWGLPQEGLPYLGALGFNAATSMRYGYRIATGELPAAAAHVRDEWLDAAEAAGIDTFESHSPISHDKRLLAKYPRVRADGTTSDRNIDVSNPAAMDELLRGVQAYADTVDPGRRSLIGVFPTTEVRDQSFPSQTAAFRERWRRASGGEPLPAQSEGRIGPSYDAIEGFPLSRAIPDDFPLLRFYRWFWRDGDGWNEFCSRTVEIYRRRLGRDFHSFYDPAVRVPPIWGTGGSVSHLNQWTYVYPEPYNISYVTAETAAMARGSGQGVDQMIQAISYRSQTSPRGAIDPAKEPEWSRAQPDAVYITTAPDMALEAFWVLFSHKLDGLMMHGFSSLTDESRVNRKNPHRSYRYTNHGLEVVVSNLFNGVAYELGPLFRALPESGAEVALIESTPAWLFAARGGWGWGGRTYNDFGTMATLANLSPYVLYDEEIARDGIPASTKVLLMPHCDVVTETTRAAVERFQLAGGTVIADGFLAPCLLADADYPPFVRTGKAATDTPALRAAAMRLKALATASGRYVPVADSDRDDILVRNRRCPSADYLFAINDRRGPGDYFGPWGLVWEKGLPNAGRVSVARAAKAVYDLAAHAEVPFEVRDGRTWIDVSYETNDGRVFLVADEKLGPLAVRWTDAGLRVTSPDRGLMVPIRVAFDGGRTFYGCVKNGDWKPAFDLPAGVRRVTVTNLADGSATVCERE